MSCLSGDNFNKITKKANLLYCRTYLGQPVFLAALEILFSALLASGHFRFLTATLAVIARTIELQSMGQHRTPHPSPRDTRPTEIGPKESCYKRAGPAYKGRRLTAVLMVMVLE